MAETNGKSWIEHLRVITPVMIFALGVYVNMINISIGDLKKSVDNIQAEMFHHLTNSELHIPRATVVSKDEFIIYQMMRDKQMADLKDGIVRIEAMLNKR